ncbi:unnamed protein product [Dibothriocephalus latus]|uniref:Peptidase C2 calpain domain-containing protein n=1 Tax=Dibothriocephalus latus TaxID=60516 RepID=A0A3P7N7G8_DIBLA|nr:unnamed protein product [Dibothriocephalus latus]
MCYEDFVREYEKMEICHLGPQSLSDSAGSDRITFQMTVEHGTWQPGVNAGGCRNFLDADDNDNEDKGTLIIGLMQKDRRKMRKQGLDLLTIGFMVYANYNQVWRVDQIDTVVGEAEGALLASLPHLERYFQLTLSLDRVGFGCDDIPVKLQIYYKEVP